ARHEWILKAGIQRYLQQQMEERTIAERKGKYRGPKEVKAPGKPAGKKKPQSNTKTAKSTGKPLAKKSDKKKAGPRPSRPQPRAGTLMDSEGFAPVKRRKPDAS